MANNRFFNLNLNINHKISTYIALVLEDLLDEHNLLVRLNGCLKKRTEMWISIENTAIGKLNGFNLQTIRTINFSNFMAWQSFKICLWNYFYIWFEPIFHQFAEAFVNRSEWEQMRIKIMRIALIHTTVIAIYNQFQSL